MFLYCPKENASEARASLTPETAKRLVSLGLEVQFESGIGLSSDYLDEDYLAAGAKATDDPSKSVSEADIVFRVRKPSPEQISAMKPGALHVSFLDPFNNADLLGSFSEAKLSAVSMEMMPRTTLAQKMDCISSQANLAGYFAVIRAAERLNKILPMMMTPSGTISPAKVFIIGVGVAGLQAIATAKRLGARVEAFDTRPVVEEQVRSLGAKFVKIDIGETGQTEQGYAKELTAEQLEKQRQGMAKICAQSDIVITTAKLFGRKAPILLNKEMVAGMKKGSIIVDLAAETGGNVEGSVSDEEVITENGVRIIGTAKLEACVPTHATQVYATNLANFIEHFWDKEKNVFQWKMDDDILKGCLITHDGAIVHERFKSA
jgi:NAD(P) transhydrogenase subunit alpha